MKTLKTGHVRLSKAEWYRLGGFSNSRLYRKHNGVCWMYFMAPE